MDVVNERTALAMRVSIYSIVVNLALSAGKLLAGLLGHSAAMVSDAVHSASDVFATLIVMAGIRVSAKAEDAEHPYGHDRLECVASILLAVILALTGIGIGYEGWEAIRAERTPAVPTLLPLVAAVVSILVKEGMFWYTRGVAKKINSDAMMADAWHHRSDALSSVGSLVGIAGARMGYPLLDPIASIVIAALILYTAYEVFCEAMNKLVDRSMDPAEEADIRRSVESVAGVAHIDRLTTRMFGARVFVDVEVSADDELPLRESHRIAENIHRQVEQAYPQVKHCMVHINPVSEVEHNF